MLLTVDPIGSVTLLVPGTRVNPVAVAIGLKEPHPVVTTTSITAAQIAVAVIQPKPFLRAMLLPFHPPARYHKGAPVIKLE